MTTLYEKQGKRYHVWGDYEQRYWDGDLLRVGQARLVTCPEPGTRRYVCDVDIDKAGFLAAAQVAAAAMSSAMQKAAIGMSSQNETPWTPDQYQLINKFRDDMVAIGGLVPEYWIHSSVAEIVQAGIDAVSRLDQPEDLEGLL